MLRVSVVAPTGRSLRVEIIRLRKKRKEQSYVKNLLVLKHLLKQDPRILAIPRSTNVTGDLSTVVRWSQMFGGVNLINIVCNNIEEVFHFSNLKKASLLFSLLNKV